MPQSRAGTEKGNRVAEPATISEIAGMIATVALMARQGLSLIWHNGLGTFGLRGTGEGAGLAIHHTIADKLMEKGLVSLSPGEGVGNELVFRLTAEGRRQAVARLV